MASEVTGSAASCGHPNHGALDHDCTPFLSTSAATSEYVAKELALPCVISGLCAVESHTYIAPCAKAVPSAATPDWHALYTDAMAKFTAETRTTSYLVGLLREAQTPCQRCGGMTGSAVLVVGDERTFVCGICTARTPDFEARLAERMRDDKRLLDRLAEGPTDE